MTALGILAFAAPASAWIFSEHADLTDDGVQELPRGARVELGRVVADAAELGFRMCPNNGDGTPLIFEANTEPPPLFGSQSADCFTYATLPALAADHSSTTLTLAEILATGESECEDVDGLRVVGVVLDERRSIIDPGTIQGHHNFVRQLDNRMFIMDAEYVNRTEGAFAHFIPEDQTVMEQYRSISGGEGDHALAKFLLHHLASLSYARRARNSTGADAESLRRHAFLEHAFAVHFIQDAFAAGHQVNSVDMEPDDRLRRHDYYTIHGIWSGRALDRSQCGVRDASGVDACWTSRGDGHLSVRLGDAQRRNTARAIASVQMQFVLARRPEWGRSLLTARQPSESLRRVADLLDPIPAWWANNASARRMTDERAAAVVEGFMAALEQVTPDLPNAGTFADLAGSPRRCPGTPNDSRADPGSPAVCANGTALSLGSVSSSIVRPLLMIWPEEKHEGLLDGSWIFHRGWSFAFDGNLRGGGHYDQSWTGAVGYSAGVEFGYRAHALFPGASNQVIGSLGVGVGVLHQEGQEPIGEIYAQLRFPALSRGLALLLQNCFGASQIINTWSRHIRILSGARLYFRWHDGPISSWDVEALSFTPESLGALNEGWPARRTPFELRVRLGQSWVPHQGSAFMATVEASMGLSFL